MSNNYEALYKAAASIKLMFSNPRMGRRLRNEKQARELSNQGNKNLNKEFLELKISKPTFFDQFDYDWFLDQSFFSGYWERYLQLTVLKTLSDIPSDHPDFTKCGSIILKIVDAESYYAESREFGGYKWIILSSSLLDIIRSYFWYLGELESYGKSHGVLDDLSFNGTIKSVGDHEFVKSKTLAFLGTIMNIASFKTSLSFTPDISSNEHEKYFKYVPAGELVETYIITHELAHILKNTIGNKRSIESEVMTDYDACSLYIIAENKLKFGRTYFNTGPILFFELSLLFLFFRMVRYNQNPRLVGFFDGSEIKELIFRRDFYINHVKKHYYGFAKLVDQYSLTSEKYKYQFDYMRNLFFNSIKSN